MCNHRSCFFSSFLSPRSSFPFLSLSFVSVIFAQKTAFFDPFSLKWLEISIEEEDWERVEIATIGVGIRAKEVMFARGGDGVYITFSKRFQDQISRAPEGYNPDSALYSSARTRRKVSNAQETDLILNHQGHPTAIFGKISVRKTIWELAFSEHLL